jgi:acetolactate synthase-1/2/3 large subunit
MKPTGIGAVEGNVRIEERRTAMTSPTSPTDPPAVSLGGQAPKIEAVEALVRVLAEEGVKVLFGIPGSHTIPLFDAIASSGAIRVILPRHEEGAAFMADGYARVSRQVAVCSGTCGPGATNLVTGLAASFADGIPVIALTGQTPAAAVGRTAHQESSGLGRTPNQVELLTHVTKSSFSTLRASKIPHLLRTAFRVALTGRFGPVNVSIPSDTFYDKIAFDDVERSS